jgi:hypothetical protein
MPGAVGKHELQRLADKLDQRVSASSWRFFAATRCPGLDNALQHTPPSSQPT